jgi:hypothetical protein
MDNVNQPQGQEPQENSPTQPIRFTPGWPGGAQGGPGSGAPPGGPRWQPSGAQGPYNPQGPPGPQGPQGPFGPQWQPGGPGPAPASPAPFAGPKDRKYSKRLRWTAGIAAAALLGAGGTIAGLTLTSPGGPGGPAGNGAQAAALNSALSATPSCASLVPGSASGGKSGSSAKSSGKSGRRGCLRLRLRHIRGMYGEIAFHTSDGTKTLAFERGQVVSFSGGALVLKARNGTEWTWTVASSSILRESGKQVSSSQLTSGADVFVGGQIVGSSKDARVIVIRKQTSGQSSSSGSSSSSSSSGSSA